MYILYTLWRYEYRWTREKKDLYCSRAAATWSSRRSPAQVVFSCTCIWNIQCMIVYTATNKPATGQMLSHLGLTEFLRCEQWEWSDIKMAETLCTWMKSNTAMRLYFFFCWKNNKLRRLREWTRPLLIVNDAVSRKETFNRKLWMEYYLRVRALPCHAMIYHVQKIHHL